MTQHSCTATAVSPRQSPPPRGICGAESAPGPAGTRGWRGRAGTAAGTDRDCPGAGHPQLGKQPGNLAGSAVRVCFALYLTCARTAAFLFFPFTQNNPLDSLRFTTFFFFFFLLLPLGRGAAPHVCTGSSSFYTMLCIFFFCTFIHSLSPRTPGMWGGCIYPTLL